MFSCKESRFKVPDKFYMLLDMDRGTLSFQVLHSYFPLLYFIFLNILMISMINSYGMLFEHSVIRIYCE